MSKMSQNTQNHSTKQPAILTDMLTFACSHQNFYFSIPFKSEKKAELNELDEVE